MREMSLLSFYQFSQRLANAEENGVKIIRVNESCTSKTFVHCGESSSFRGSKTFTCKKPEENKPLFEWCTEYSAEEFRQTWTLKKSKVSLLDVSLIYEIKLSSHLGMFGEFE